MPKAKTKTNYLTNIPALESIKTKEQEQELERQIREFVASVGINLRFAVTGDHNYILETDGTIFLELGGNRIPIQYWNSAQHWKIFTEDVKHNRLIERLKQLGKKHDDKRIK